MGRFLWERKEEQIENGSGRLGWEGLEGTRKEKNGKMGHVG